MTVHKLEVPGRLAMTHFQDQELIDRVREAKRRACVGEDISDVPFNLTDVILFKRRLRPKVTWRGPSDKPLFQRMVEAKERAE